MRDQLDALISQMIEKGVHYEDAVREFEKHFIQKALRNHDGNKSKTALTLGIHRNTLTRKIAEVGLDHQPRRRKRA